MPNTTDFDRLTETSAQLMAKASALAAVEAAQYQVRIRLVYHAQNLETERQVRHAQRMDDAVNQLIVHVVVSIVTLGLTAAVEAVMAGAYAAEGAYATTQGVRYAQATAAIEEAMAAKAFMERVNKLVQIAQNPALRNILVEYKCVEYMIKAPTLGINYALGQWTEQTQGRAYEFNVPEAPGSDKGTFLRDEKGKLRNPGLDFLKLAKQVYDRWGREQQTERAFLENLARISANAFRTTLSQDLGNIPQDTRVFLSMNRTKFSELDGVLNREVGAMVRRETPGISDYDLRLAVSAALSPYWQRPFSDLTGMKTRLQVQIHALSNEVARLERQVKLSLNRQPAVRFGQQPTIGDAAY